MQRYEGLETFVEVVNCGSFSTAADKLSVSKSHVSKQIARLEDRLGARLLNRTTRTVKLTDVGAGYYSRCSQILSDLEEAELAISNLQQTPRGSLRITAAGHFGEKYIGPAVADFLAKYPGLSIEINFTSRTLDIVEEGYDLAIRFGRLQDSSLIARKIASRRMYMCASPEYIKNHGRPEVLEDLKQHNCLRGFMSSWPIEVNKELINHKVSGNWRSNNGNTLLVAAERGIGVVQLPHFYIQEQLASGKLVEVLPEYNGFDTSTWAVYPHNRHLSTKVRMLVDFLIEYFREDSVV
jgi:DNA-binding transcriptional LysR family regulator